MSLTNMELFHQTQRILNMTATTSFTELHGDGESNE